jgi:hypothetical protein
MLAAFRRDLGALPCAAPARVVSEFYLPPARYRKTPEAIHIRLTGVGFWPNRSAGPCGLTLELGGHHVLVAVDLHHKSAEEAIVMP